MKNQRVTTLEMTMAADVKCIFQVPYGQEAVHEGSVETNTAVKRIL